MGQEIHTAQFDERDFAEFTRRLNEETDILKRWFKNKIFERNINCCGFELEGWLVNADKNPAPLCLPFLEKLDDPLVVPEISLFNFEYNSNPRQLDESLLTKFHDELNEVWQKARVAGEAVGAEPVSIGILPTLEQSQLTLDNFHPHKRYEALNKHLKRMLGHENVCVNIAGREPLDIQHDNILVETVATSLQIHLQMNASKAVRYYNAGFLVAAPLVALAANAPFLFQKSLWEETRIPVFEQVIDVAAKNNPSGQALERVTFGDDYVHESIFELFQQNLNYAVLLPELTDKKPEALSHLKIHNGTIWRWNRPIIDTNKSGVPHLRLEHRVAAAGTSAVDTIANIAFFLGFLRQYAYCRLKPQEILSFQEVKENFYAAAKYGLDAKVAWKGERDIPLKKLILEEILPFVRKGLEKLNILPEDIKVYLDDIITARVESGITGSVWQRRFIENSKSVGKQRFCDMMQKYLEYQRQNLPVHLWPML